MHLRKGTDAPRSLNAATLFGVLAGIFTLLLITAIALLVADQRKLLDSVTQLRTQALPTSIEQQRLARNIETLRLEGERVLSASTPQARQQAMFVVNLMASHPSILGNPRARDIATETELFLTRVTRGEQGDSAVHAEWAQLSRRLSLAADDISVEAVSLARGEVATMGAVIEGAQQKLYATLAITLVFVIVLLLLMHRRLILPLQRIDATLKTLGKTAPVLDLPPGSLHEIKAIEGAIGQLHDILQKHEETRDELERLAATDMLTGLNNRREFMHIAAGEVARSQRYGRPVTVGLADLDHFKRINDQHGHAAGDLALRAFADLVRSTLRHADTAGRYGGEEFAFVFPETTPEEAAVLSNRLRSRLDAMVIALPDGATLRMTLSIGIADASVRSLEEALSVADQALYEAKASGRNTVVLRPMAGLSILPPDFDR